MKGDKLTVVNLCGGEFQAQVENALRQVAKNIEKYGSAADHDITVKLTFSENLEFGFWEHDAKTTVGCKTQEKQIGSKAPMKVANSVLYDGNTQQKLPIV